MRIAEFGATGLTGRRMVEQGLDRGHDLAAFILDVRHHEQYVRELPEMSY